MSAIPSPSGSVPSRPGPSVAARPRPDAGRPRLGVRLPSSAPVDRGQAPRLLWGLAGLIALAFYILGPRGIFAVPHQYWSAHPGLEWMARAGTASAVVLGVRWPRRGVALWALSGAVGALYAWLLTGMVHPYAAVETLPALLAVLVWPWWWPRLSRSAPRPRQRLLADDLQRRWLLPVLVIGVVVLVASLPFSSPNWHPMGPIVQHLAVPIAFLPLVTLLRPWWGVAYGAALTVWGVLATSADPTLPFVLMAALVCAGVIAGTQRPRAQNLLVGTAGLAVIAAGAGKLAVIMPLGYHIQSPDGSFQSSILVGQGMLMAITFAVTALLRRQAEAEQVLDENTAAVAVRETELSERARLARDLHDVVAHHVSLIAVRAETAPYTHPTLDAEGRKLLADIASDARNTLEELRGVLGVLRRSDVDGTPAVTAPLPGGNDLLPLIERNQAIGMDITISDLRGAYTDLVYASGRGHVLYRVLQEALTNARRHAPGEPVLVVLADSAPQLVVTNTTNGPGSDVGSGTGLIGIRERVEAMGGQVVIEQGDAFRLEVHFDD